MATGAHGHEPGAPTIVSLSEVHDCTSLPGFAALIGGQAVGALTFRENEHGFEVVTIDSYRPGIGVGTALLDAVRGNAVSRGAARLWLTTTHDNVHALAFYLRRGWRLIAIHRGAVAGWREPKPSIPPLGDRGIPIEDALELELPL